MTSSSSSSSEGEWIAQVADGDADAFARLYDAWSSRLFALILQIVVDRAQSEEVLQEVFLEVWRTAGSFSQARGSARAWLVTMARRRAIDRVRSSQSSRDRESRWHDYMPDVDLTVQQVEDRLVGEQVHRALEAVGEPYRSTIELAYFTGLTHREIARRTGTPLGTVKTRIRDGMARLRRELGVQS
ncbi:RNA polymerase subunit sigma [Actinomyces oris]|uniref:RNA polymerase subunit sigma n=1 Tax=Actinomyces oris TaxID=544580 RepID=A0A1Q8VMB7_9ACTO|nr:RNA polymerase subunit sigma [Actinomyces oris]